MRFQAGFLFVLLFSSSTQCFAEFWDSDRNDAAIDLLITCLVRELQRPDGRETWKACIDPDLARTRFDISITDAPGQDFTYDTTGDELFGVFATGISTGQGANNVEAGFTAEGLPPRGAIIANSFFSTSGPTGLTTLPTDRVTISQGPDDFNIRLDNYARAVRKTEGNLNSPIAFYRFNVGIDRIVRNIGTGGVKFDGEFNPPMGLNEAGVLVDGPNTAGIPFDGFETSNTGIDTADPDWFVRVPPPDNDQFTDVFLNDLSFSLWFNPALDNGFNIITSFSGFDGNGARFVSLVYVQDDIIRLNLGAGLGFIEGFIEPESWNHVVAVIDSADANAELYVNGELQADEFAELNDFQLTNFVIGDFVQNFNVEPFVIDEFAVWDSALPEESVLAMFEASMSPDSQGNLCDFDSSGALDLDDAELLRAAIAAMSTDPGFDVDGNGLINLNDLIFFVTAPSKLFTYFGDVNFDGEFNSIDIILLFQHGKYEANVAANWFEGDFNADGFFNSTDLIFLFQQGGYEQGLRTAATVPEPYGATWLFMGGLAVLGVSTRLRRHEIT